MPRRDPFDPTAPLQPGDTVWLVPRTMGAPGVAYQHPEATVVAVNGQYAGNREVRVRLHPHPGLAADGEITVSPSNVTRTRPRPPAERRPRPASRPRLELGSDEREVTLW